MTSSLPCRYFFEDGNNWNFSLFCPELELGEVLEGAACDLRDAKVDRRAPQVGQVHDDKDDHDDTVVDDDYCKMLTTMTMLTRTMLVSIS